MRSLRFALALISGLTVAGSANAYTISSCSSAGEAEIDRLQLDRTKISRVQSDPMYSGGENLEITGYNLWLRSDSCDGSLVLVFTSSCRFLDTFTRGDCTVASFKT